jgi:hypothetical protein
MAYENFDIHFNWKNKRREVQIRTPKIKGISPVVATYEVHSKNTLLFTIYPTFNKNCNKVWMIVEKERESYLPYGFIAALGNIIDDAYVIN